MVTTWIGSIGGGLPDFLITIESFDEEHVNYPNRPLRMTVVDTHSDEIILEWNASPWISHWDRHDSFMPDMGLTIVDLDFDGYKDIMFFDYVGLEDNYDLDDLRTISYAAYLWDTEKGKYESCSSFSSLLESPIIDEDRQVILVFTSGYEGTLLNYDIYKIIGGQVKEDATLIVKKDFKSASNDYQWGFQDRRTVDGRVQVVAQFFASSDTMDDPPEEAAEYFESGSFWDLDNPIWRTWMDR